MLTTHSVSCQCGRIRLSVTADLDEIVECNCSLCSRTAFLHWYVPPQSVSLMSGGERLSTYVWRSATGGQHFCPTCGIAVIRTSTQFPPPVSVNARCIEGVDLAALKITQFDGKRLL
jgi:hypothetical protein